MVTLLASISFAEEKDICFPYKTADQIVQDLEKAKIDQEQLKLMDQAISKLNEQIKLLNEKSSIQKQQLDDANKTIETLKEASKLQEKVCEEKIANAKTPWYKQMFYGLGAVGLGVLVGLLL